MTDVGPRANSYGLQTDVSQFGEPSLGSIIIRMMQQQVGKGNQVNGALEQGQLDNQIGGGNQNWGGQISGGVRNDRNNYTPNASDYNQYVGSFGDLSNQQVRVAGAGPRSAQENYLMGVHASHPNSTYNPFNPLYPQRITPTTPTWANWLSGGLLSNQQYSSYPGPSGEPIWGIPNNSSSNLPPGRL